MFELMRKVRKRQQETGSSDLITTVLMIPFVVFSLLAMVDIGLYFQSRMTAQNMARDAVRQVAMWGGTDTRLTPYNIEERLEDSLDDVCGQLRCKTPPKAVCGIGNAANAKATRGNYAKVQASEAGQNTYCIIEYRYAPVSFIADQAFGGFNDVFNLPVKVVEQGQTETGFR